MTSRELKDLHPACEQAARAFLAATSAAGISVLVYCTLRSNDAQRALYAQGRTTPGKIVTNAKPGESWHNYGLAFDCVPLRDGKPVWGNSRPEDSQLWKKLGAIGEANGLSWAGKWKGSLKETAHFQLKCSLTIDDLKKGLRP